MSIELKTDKPFKEKGKLVHRIYCSKCLKADCEHWPVLTKPTNCRCGTPIIFARGISGKLLPLESEDLESHFAHCTFADFFRKKR